MRNRTVAGFAFGIFCALGMAHGAWGLAAYKEDLSACKLPHGEKLIPLAGTPGAARGDLFKLSDGSLAVLAGEHGEPRVNRAAAASDLRGKNAGDLEFMPDDKGSFWAVSGRIVNVGARYLYEAAAMKLDRPAAILGDASRPPGYLPGIEEGNTYLLQTADGHFALLRVLEIDKAGARVQYVYQPTGQVQFTIPRATLVEQTPPTAAPAVPAPEQNSGRVIGAIGAPGTLVIHVGDDLPGSPEPSMQAFLAQRQRMIASRLKIVEAAAKTPEQIRKKVAAIDDLGALHAGEAAAALVARITFVNPDDAGSGSFKDTVHPCFAALKKLGRPARDAALQALRQLDLKAVPGGDILQSPGYRATLLGLVIRAVEGDTAGAFMLKQERDATTDPARRAMYDQLLSPRP